MKKLFLSLLAVAALASCSKTESAYVDQDQEIKLNPVTSLVVKSADATAPGAIDGTTYPTTEEFDVYAYWKNEPAGSKFNSGYTPYLTGDGSGVEFNNKGLYWGGVTTYYWPKNGSLRFAAYSPSSVDMTHELATDTYSVAGYVQPHETSKTWDLLVAPTSPSYTAQTAAENVSVVFEHALSWITLKVVAKDIEAAKAFDIKKVTINDVITTADLEAVMTGEDKGFNWTPSTTEPTANYQVYAGSQAVTTEAKVIETVNQGTLVIPQATTSVTVDYTQNALDGTPELAGQTVTVDLVLDKDNTPWEAGKHYVYTLIFGLDEILINPSVVDWEDVIVNDVEVGTTNVYSVAQLEAALANGGNIVLQADLETTSLKASKDAFLNLNGHTITGTDALTTSYALIEVQPDVTFTVEGPGTLVVKEATNNRGWNAFSSVLSNQRGTLIVNDGVVVEHLGGTDMAYGIDNLTNTGSQSAITIVNGATVKSTYRAIRQFLNSTTGSNELYVNSGSKITGTNKSIWAQNANNKANIGKLVVKEGAQLNGDVMLSASNAPVWAMEASISASTLVAPSTVVPSNVPSGYAVVLADGVYTVVKGATGVATADALAAALAAAEENISVILTAGMDLTATEMHVAAGKNVVVDLGGQTVNVKALDPIKNLGTMTLKNGKVVAENSESTRRCVYNYGTMIIENVEFVQTYDMKGAAINNEGIMTINNATVNAAYYSVWASGADSETIINGGKFTTTNTVGKDGANAYAIRVAEGKLTVNNAEVSGNHGVVSALDGALATLNSGTFTLATPCFTAGGNSSWVFYAAYEGVVNYSEASCTLVKPDTKTNGYNTTENGGIVKSF